MKTFTALLLTLALALSLAACGGDTGSDPAPASNPPETDTAAPNTPDQSEDTAGTPSGQTLVVYFSATGNTEQAAGYIAELTGGDLFELEPAQPYTDDDLDWTDDNSRVVYEHDNPDDRHVELTADTVENWDSYDTVFIGYPIWWGIAAWPVDTFVKTMTLPAKPSSPSAPLPAPAWEKAASCWPIWPAPATGWRDSDSPPASPRRRCRSGWTG